MIDTFLFFNEAFPEYIAAFIFVFGAITGSFLNVCIYRIPEGRSVVFPGSTCSCGQPIAWYNNIPILTWLFLRGRASCCGQSFSVRYPAIEMLTGLLFYASWSVHPPVVAIIGFLFVAFLICSTFIDFDHMIIPDRFSIGGMLVGVGLSFCFPALHGVAGEPIVSNMQAGIASIVGALLGAGLVYWIAVLGEIVFRKPAMGEGDVKFVGFIGAFCGWQGAVFAMFGGAFIGSMVLLPILLLGRIFRWGVPLGDMQESVSGGEDAEESVQFGTQVPFGPMLAVGGLIYFLGFDRYVDAYFVEFAAMVLGQ